MFQGLSPKYHDGRYDILFPGSEIPKWFTNQCLGDKVNIMEPFSHLCNDWIGIAVCVVFCTLPPEGYKIVSCLFSVNGKYMSFALYIKKKMVSSLDHIWLLYLLPQNFSEEDIKSLWECDENGFRHIGITIEEGISGLVKKCGLRVVYKKDIEDLNSTMVQCSNNSIIPYTGLKSP